MGCTASAPTALEARRAASAAAAAAAGTKLLPGGGDGSEVRITETREPKTERVLPACDSVQTSLGVDSRNEFAATVTANDVHVIDLESEPSPRDDIVELGHLRIASPADKSLQEEHRLPPPPAPSPKHPSPPPPPPPVPMPVEALEILLHSPETDPAIAESAPLGTRQDTDTGENDISEEEWSSLPGSALERRPTRWEALTDVAAELPPKLTVDPLTGQIYALKRD